MYLFFISLASAEHWWKPSWDAVFSFCPYPKLRIEVVYENEEIKDNFKEEMKEIKRKVKYHLGVDLIFQGGSIVSDPDFETLQGHRTKYNLVTAHVGFRSHATEGRIGFEDAVMFSNSTSFIQQIYRVFGYKKENCSEISDGTHFETGELGQVGRNQIVTSLLRSLRTDGGCTFYAREKIVKFRLDSCGMMKRKCLPLESGEPFDHGKLHLCPRDSEMEECLEIRQLHISNRVFGCTYMTF